MTNPCVSTSPELCGRVRDAATGSGLSGYSVTALDAGDGAGDWIGRTFTQPSGEFFLRYEREDLVQELDRETGEGGPDVLLVVETRFGREVERLGPLAGATRFAAICIDVEVEADDDEPGAGSDPDPFDVLAGEYANELAVLTDAGFNSREALLGTRVEDLAEAAGLDVGAVAALRLSIEMLAVEGFDRDLATALAAAGYGSQARLAAARPQALLEALQEAQASGALGSDRVTAEGIHGLWSAAHGVDLDDTGRLDVGQVLVDTEAFTRAVLADSPGATITDVSSLLTPVQRFDALAEARALMEAAGVNDLGALGPIEVRGRREIGPGVYVAHPRSGGNLVADHDRLRLLLSRSASLRSVVRVEALADSVRFVPNPVTDSVLIGALVNFAVGGRLVIAPGVSSLTLITPSIKKSEISEITWAGRSLSPPKPPDIQPKRAPRGTPTHDPDTYTAGTANDGRDGGRGYDGADGAPGADGDSMNKPPSLTVYALRFPEGLPRIDLRGRRGGEGQHGQHGGPGGGGAGGGKASAWVFGCTTQAGSGGTGGKGGDGGDGGKGGRGGTGGEVKIVTLDSNLLKQSGQVLIAGGPGGWGGGQGISGPGGAGGFHGSGDWIWCPDRAGRAAGGSRGVFGSVGPLGDAGKDGKLTVQPVTVGDWLRSFNHPRIVRVTPAKGFAGSHVHVAGSNITRSTHVLVNGKKASEIGRDSDGAGGWKAILITTHGRDSGEQRLQLRQPVPGGKDKLSNQASHRIRPLISKLSPERALPDTELVLRGNGFVAGAQVLVDNLALAPSSLSLHEIKVTLPDDDSIGLKEGKKKLVVRNPDGCRSNEVDFTLDRTIVVRIRAWRVFADRYVSGGSIFGVGPLGTGWSKKAIRNIFDDSKNSLTPNKIWSRHGIRIVLDSRIDDIYVRADFAITWPRQGNTVSVIKARDSAGDFRHFDPGAVNVYFVRNIDEMRVGAFATDNWMIFEGIIRSWDPWPAVLLSHELGHNFGLPHTCDSAGGGTLGRKCDQPGDNLFLMYWDMLAGTTVLAKEASKARGTARLLHRR